MFALKNKYKPRDILYALSLIFFVFFSLPFAFNSLIGGSYYRIVMICGVFFGLIFFLVSYSFNISKLFNKEILLVFLFKIAVWSILMLIHCDIKYIDEILITSISILAIAVSLHFGLCRTEYYILRIASLMALLSIIGFFLIVPGNLSDF
jgi:hypothetical protein